MLMKPAILLTATSIALASSKHTLEGDKWIPIEKEPRQLTWEDCVEFHFDDCTKEVQGLPVWTYFKTTDEANCISYCQDCSNECPGVDGKKTCHSIINNMRDHVNPSPKEQSDCWSGADNSIHDLTDRLCRVSWGTIKSKEAVDRYALLPCLALKEMHCLRGQCDMDGHLEQIDTVNDMYLPKEEECMDACHSHINANEGDCTHYKWVADQKGERRGQCIFYKRKNTTTAFDTNYKCELYALKKSTENEFGFEDIAACKSGGRKNFKGTDSCREMCDAKKGQDSRIQLPIAMAIDSTSSQGDDKVPAKLNELINGLNLTKAPAYQLVEFGHDKVKEFPERTDFAQFKADLDTLNMTLAGNYTFFEKGLKVVTEKAREHSFILATIDQRTNRLDLEGLIAKTLSDKRQTLFIALNPAFTGHADSMEAYNRLASGSGGKVVDIAKGVDELVSAVDGAMQNVCSCDLLVDPQKPENKEPIKVKTTVEVTMTKKDKS